ncbi:MAG: ABC transporter ATP-binding protein [Chlamydiae bacterium]|nr:ABC transporter ATP-binding protein [Chlamydiota bacterium]MBI3266172.1 ABC transporter ATP-binding protein [Chlamydiota bacterium]
MTTYRRLLQFVKPYWPRLATAFLCMILFSIFNTAVVWVLKFVLRVAFVSKSPSMFFMVPGLILLVFLMRGLSDFGQAYYMNWVGLKAVSDIRDRLYRHLHDLSLDFFSHRKTGHLISRVTNDVSVIQYGISNAITDMVKEPLSLLGLLGTLFYFDPFLASMSLFIFPLAVYPIVKFGKRVRKATRQAQTQVGDLTSILHETISGIRVVKAFSMEEYEINRFSQENRRFFKSMMDAVRAAELTRPVIEVVASCGAAFCFWYGARHLSLDTFLSFMTALYLIYEPFKKIGKVNSLVQQANAAGVRVFEILDEVPAVRDKKGAFELSDIREGIRFSNLAFRYEEDWVLRDIHFEMKAGEITALVGPSGSGKSTMANLIARFYDPQQGEIKIDGKDIRSIALKSLRGLMGLVTQEVILFNDTVRANIAYGRVEMNSSELIEAAQAANAHDFIMALPERYDTLVGERGVKLSGGERQRLAIARAILKNPRLLILDEATSSLDSQSERSVQEALTRLMEGRTVLVIAHRLSTVRNAHQILVLNQGRMIQTGTHDELIQKEGLYRKLYEVQFAS